MKKTAIIFGLLLFISLFSFVVAQEDAPLRDTDRLRDRIADGTESIARDVVMDARKRLQDNYVERKEAIRQAVKDTADCDSETLTREQRIRCRLYKADYTTPTDALPESCRRLSSDTVSCQELLKNIRECHAKEGEEQRICMHRIAGIASGKLSDEDPQERGQKARRYVVGLLDALENRVEKKLEADEIDPDDAVALIEKIAEIKEKILDGSTKEEVREMMAELKEMWRAAISDYQDAASDDDDSQNERYMCETDSDCHIVTYGEHCCGEAMNVGYGGDLGPVTDESCALGSCGPSEAYCDNGLCALREVVNE